MSASSRRKGDIVLATCVDEAYLPLVQVLATSIAWHSASPRRIILHVFSSGPKTALSERIGRFRRGNVAITLHYVDNPWVGTPIGANYPPSTYLRLSLPQLMPDEKRVLYLDADTIVLDDISRLFDVSLKGCALGAAIDLGMLYNRQRAAKLRTRDWSGTYNRYVSEVLKLTRPEEYVNTGVLLLDLHELRQLDFTSRCRELLAVDGGKFRFVDQDAINRLMQGKIRLLDIQWNVFAREFQLSEQDYSNPGAAALNVRARRRPRLLHFSGSRKPWHPEQCYAAHLWWHYADLSPDAAGLRSHYRPPVAPLIALPPLWSRFATEITNLRYVLRRLKRQMFGGKGKRPTSRRSMPSSSTPKPHAPALQDTASAPKQFQP